MNTETAQDTFNEWYTVKKNKKHKKQKKEKSDTMQQDVTDKMANNDGPMLSNSIEFERLVDQGDYIIKSQSKKKKKKQRKMEEELSKSMKSLKTESSAKSFDMDSMLNGVLDYSKAIKKETNRKQKNKLRKNPKKSKNQKCLDD